MIAWFEYADMLARSKGVALGAFMHKIMVLPQEHSSYIKGEIGVCVCAGAGLLLGALFAVWHHWWSGALCCPAPSSLMIDA